MREKLTRFTNPHKTYTFNTCTHCYKTSHFTISIELKWIFSTFFFSLYEMVANGKKYRMRFRLLSGCHSKGLLLLKTSRFRYFNRIEMNTFNFLGVCVKWQLIKQNTAHDFTFNCRKHHTFAISIELKWILFMNRHNLRFNRRVLLFFKQCHQSTHSLMNNLKELLLCIIS